MKRELQYSLIKKYHVFFDWTKNIKEGEPIHPMQFGIECGNGWYWLLDSLMSSIYNYQKYNKKEGEKYIRVKQIKEKFGGLCFYYDGGNEVIRGMVWQAEHQSRKICEYCGSTENIGKTTGWISIMCKTCYDRDTKIGYREWIPIEDKRLLKLARLKILLNKNANIS